MADFRATWKEKQAKKTEEAVGDGSRSFGQMFSNAFKGQEIEVVRKTGLIVSVFSRPSFFNKDVHNNYAAILPDDSDKLIILSIDDITVTNIES